MHESVVHRKNCFVTLTYDDKSLPYDSGLHHRDFKLFMRRLVKRYGKTSYFMCGEYGEHLRRPHFHAALFGIWFKDSYEWKRKNDIPLFRSPTLEALWPHGMSTVGTLTLDSAQYVASYVTKKVTGSKAVSHYENLCPITGEIFSIRPEYARMSLRPAIGKRFVEKFRGDVFPRDYCILDGVKHPLPRYYSDLLLKEASFDEVFNVISSRREKVTKELRADCTPARLAVQERVVKGRLNLKTRSL